MAKKFVSPPIDLGLGAAGTDFTRADIHFRGVDHAGPSFEARVFLNNPEADEHTPQTLDHGYAGSFHVYGYGVFPEGPRTAAGKPPEAPAERYIMATEAVRRAAHQGKKATVTVVPVVTGMADGNRLDAPLKLDGVSIVTYNQ